MAVSTRKTLFVITYLCLALLLCLVMYQTEAKVARVRRQECEHGEYDFDQGIKCCKCPNGSRVKEHCTKETKISPCTVCVSGEYQSYANPGTTCESCTSCAHPNVNLEEDTPCTRFQNSICKCKKNHYCPSGKTPCDICEPCRNCGPEGEKVSCSATNNTICNEKSQDNTLGITLGVIFPLMAAGAALGFYLWKKRKSGRENIENLEFSEENVHLRTVGKTDSLKALRPHIPQIAEVIGWKTMKNLAINSNIPKGKLESCEEAKDSVERTIALLNIWEEKESKNAAPKLLEYLRKTNQNSTADDVYKILCGS